jgi:hypothetical protein
MRRASANCISERGSGPDREFVRVGRARESDDPKTTSQVTAVLASPDEALVESVYAGLRSAGLPLPEVQGTNFEVTGFSLGGMPLECHVSVSRDNPAKFDVALMAPDGLMKPFRLPPAACPMLFLFDGEDVINPRR